MEQLWYTWSTNGPRIGFQIRAASPGLSEGDARIDELLQYVRYRLPAGTYHTDPNIAPVSLSLTDTKKYGFIAVRKVYKGLDGAQRPGNFFCHLVLLNEQSAYFSFREAIDLWKSGFWRESESENDARVLSQVDRTQLASTLMSPFGQFDYSHRPALVSLFSRVLQAFLTHENRRRFYILAPSQVVTALIWGIAHALPCTLPWWKQITFTTYDDEVGKASEFIVGTYRTPNSSSQDLPEFCYTGNNLALQIDPVSFQIRREYLPDLSDKLLCNEYVIYAAECLVSGNSDELFQLVNSAEQLGCRNIPAFLDFFEKEIKGKPLTLAQILEALLNKTADEVQLKKAQNQDVLVNALLQSALLLEQETRDALFAFSRRAESDPETNVIYLSLLRKFYAGIEYAMKNRNGVVLYRLLQAMVIQAPATKDPTLWQKLARDLSIEVTPFAPVSATSLFPWETRALLLSQWVLIFNPYNDSAIHAWLKVAWIDLGSLLRCVPERWYRAIFSFRMEVMEIIPSPVIAEVSEIVERYAEDPLKQIVQEFVQGSKGLAHAVAYFVHQLVANKMPMRLELLNWALEVDVQGEFAKTANGAFSLEKEDHLDFVQAYLTNLLSLLYVPAIAELMKNYLARYFELHEPAELVDKLLIIRNLVYSILEVLRSIQDTFQTRAVLNLLARNVLLVLKKITYEWQSSIFFSYLEILRRLAPADIGDVSQENWLELLSLQIDAGQLLPWATRELLLLQWAHIAMQIKIKEVARWLDVSWTEIEQLLTLLIPEEWKSRAIEIRILERPTQQNTLLPVEAKGVIERYANKYFAPVLEMYVTKGQPGHVEAAVQFVVKLLKQQFPMRLDLLLQVLKADVKGQATEQLSNVYLEDDLFVFVERYLPDLLGNILTQQTAHFIYLSLYHYFEGLDPADLTKHESIQRLLMRLNEYLALLNTNQSPRWKELEAYVKCWLEIKKFVELGSRAISLNTVHSFHDAISGARLPDKTRQLLNDALAQLISSYDFENEEYSLNVIVYLLGKALTGTPNLLKSMVVVVGDQFGSFPPKIFPYIKLVLQFILELPDDEKQPFLRHSMNHLLKRLGRKDIQQFAEIQKRVEVLPESEKSAWELYLKESRFAPARLTNVPRTPWRYRLRPRYWRSRSARQQLREAIQGRIATSIAHAYNPKLDEYLTEDERKKVRFAKEFTEAFDANNNAQIVRMYHDIWDIFQGEIYFTPDELARIREIEKEQNAPRHAG